MGIRAIIFDLDGVLFNSTDSAGNFLWSQNIEKDLNLKTSDLKTIFSAGWLDAIKGKTDTKEYFKNVFQELHEPTATPEKFMSYWLENDVRINEDVLSIVRELGQPVYLGTNQDPYRTAVIKDMVGQHFQDMFTSCEIGFMKPETEFYAHIEKTLQLPASSLMLIDDLKPNIEEARNRGWNAHHFTGDVGALRQLLVA